MSGVHKYPTISFRISPRERDEIEVLDGELRETQTADYFSKHRRSDCAVRELTAR